MRIGAAGKWIDIHTLEQVPEMNFRISNVRNLLRFETEDARQTQLHSIVEHNLQALKLVVKALSQEPEFLRMWRIGSDVLPLYTHPSAQLFYSRTDVRDWISSQLLKIGQRARKYHIRLSFHPGQFTVLGSPNLNARANSVREFEYHAQLAEWMGYTGWHPDGFAINVHVGGKNVDPSEFIKSFKTLSETARNLITLENDEFSWSPHRILKHFGKHIPLVLDVHHYWIMHGNYANASGSNYQQILDSWRGERPKIHLAMSRQEQIPTEYQTQKLSLSTLIEQENKNKSGLRAHSDNTWHTPTLDYARTFGPNYDIMWEGKDKNLGQRAIAKYLGLLKM